MRYRALTALPFAVALVYGAAQYLAPDRVLLYRVVVLLLKLTAATGAAAAGMRFLKRDYLRTAWLLTASCFFLLFLKDLLFGIGWRHISFPMGIALARGAFTLVANVCGSIGTFLLARAWSVAGLIHPGSRAAKSAVYLAAIVLALATAGHATVIDLETLIGGDIQRIPAVASDLGDIVGLVLIAPVLLTAIALRGGLLAWPWTLMAASQIGWLLYDAAGEWGLITGARRTQLIGIEELFRGLALLYAFSSGIAQRWVMSDLRSASSHGTRRPRAA